MQTSTKNVIDLFAGVGGLSLGAARAGFRVAAAVELDSRAAEWHGRNFPNSIHLLEDVASLTGQRLLGLAGVRSGELDGLIGGPPCQGFSDIGLKSGSDPRNELLVHFFRLVSETRPAFFLAENVPGVLKERNAETLKRALTKIPRKYRLLPPITVRASDYGAPTIRKRIFFIGFDPDRVGHLSETDFLPRGISDVRVEHALEALPAIRSDWQTPEQSWRSVGELSESFYSTNLSAAIPFGVGDEFAIREFTSRRRVSGFFGTLHTQETIRRLRSLQPGKSDPISKCYRLDRQGYCPTLRAGTGPERGSYQAIRPVHPGSPRVIAPREAARLQGFPDWFQFHPTKWHAFRQIGNSVSPIVAQFLLTKIFEASS